MVGEGPCTLQLKLVLIGQGIDDFFAIICNDSQVVYVDNNVVLELMLLIKPLPDIRFGFARSESHIAEII